MNGLRVSKASQMANASPSVSMERGNYRMRAPIVQPPSFAQPRPSSSRANRNVVCFLAVLAFACISCFAFAYYLFTTRCDLRTIPLPAISPDSASQAIESLSTKLSPTNYLSYLPHSGFHNQRIAFENALLLAYLLRRTLIVPPIRLANKPIHYAAFDSLRQDHELSSKRGLSHCPNLPPDLPQPPECLDYSSSSYIPWHWLLNLSSIQSHQELLFREDMSDAWLQDNINLSSADTLTLHDTLPYQFRFLDTLGDSPPPQDRYLEDIYIIHLAELHHRHLQIGSMFGTSRLRLKNQANIEYRAFLRKSMAFANSALVQAANSISHILGDGAFIGLHIRTGDGQFKTRLEENLRLVTRTLFLDILGLSLTEYCLLQHSTTADAESCLTITTDTRPTGVSSPAFLSASYHYLSCRLPLYRSRHFQLLNIPIYIATDMKDPATNPQLAGLRQLFPCAFFLDDFGTSLQGLNQLTSPYDRVRLKPFLFPFVDAMVAGKAMAFVGTEGSTFSRFVKDILWTAYHATPANPSRI